MFILIADDEKMLRLSLQSMLEELYPNEHIYIHASNGEAAVTQVRKLPPDIAFLDIKMPLMNGLEALDLCRKISPSTKWVILSGYADFEYAQQAIRMSASSYLLKPVDLATLKHVVDEIEIVKKQEALQNNKLFTLDIIRSFSMADMLGTDEMSYLPYGERNWTIYQIYIDSQEKERQCMLKHELFCSIDRFCEENAAVSYHAVFVNTDGELCVVCDAVDPSHLTFYINSKLAEYPDGLISSFMGKAGSIEGIYKASRRISEVSDVRFVFDCRQTRSITEIDSTAGLEEILHFSSEINRLIRNALVGNQESVRQFAASLEQDSRMASVFYQISHAVLYQYLGNILAQPFCAESWSAFLKQICLAAAELSRKKPVYGFDVTAIKDFVYRNYGQDVSIALVSEYFNLSPAYFSRLFLVRTGQKYIDFVTEVRMENAKRILSSSPDVSVRKTAAEVGYTSVRHFSKTFQKYTGMLPSNWGI